MVANIDTLKALDISVLKLMLNEGKKHLKYYNDSMSSFRFPEKRMKCHDTVHYEKVVPQIEEILKEYEARRK